MDRRTPFASPSSSRTAMCVPSRTVMLDLGARLGLPGMVKEDMTPKYPGGYSDYIVNHERAPGHRSAGRFPGR